jgi:hypothetical protein
VTDCINQTAKVEKNEPPKAANKTKKKGSKLQQITSTSVAVPMFGFEPTAIMEKSSSIEVSIGKHNFEYSSNNNSKVSGPLRESELLDLNRRNGANKNIESIQEYENIQREAFLQSQEKRLPLSKISSDHSGYQERVTNGIGNSNYLNNINEIPEEGSTDYVQQMQYEETYGDFNEEEPMPKLSVPTPQPLMTNYKEVRDQKKWQKVNSGISLF